VENNFINSILCSYNRIFTNFMAENLDYSTVQELTPEEVEYFNSIEESKVESKALLSDSDRRPHSESPEDQPLKSKLVSPKSPE
jgi:hypothetical protein